MPGRLPTDEDFPDNVTVSIVPPPANQKPTNILILLHGLGDTNIPFTTLARQLSLPETACLSLRAPSKVPFMDVDGYHWGDDIMFHQGTGEMDADTGFTKAVKLVLEEVVKVVLLGKCGYKGRDVVMFGFGQGGAVAVEVAKETGNQGEELGGVVSIGGALSDTTSLAKTNKKSKTPVILCKGNKGSAIKDKDLRKLKDTFEFIEVKEWKKNGDGMPANREEMMPIMQFFARRLRSVRGVPEGSVEL